MAKVVVAEVVVAKVLMAKAVIPFEQRRLDPSRTDV